MKQLMVTEEQVYQGELLLVNAQFSYHQQLYARQPLTADGAIELEETAALQLEQLIAAVSKPQKIVPVSGFRSVAEQTQLYQQSLADHGVEFTQSYVAQPGHSEHHTGLAIDLGIKKGILDFIRPCFPYTGVAGEFREQAAAWGFIERYGKSKEAVTHIAHEPWHFRYVGSPHAQIMVEHDWCLEEYLEQLKQYPLGIRSLTTAALPQVSIAYAAITGTQQLNIPDNQQYSLSGNNVDGVIVTMWEADL